MELLAITTPMPLPAARVPTSIRVATLADLPAIDALQKLHHKQLGFFPRAQMEGYLKSGWVLVAEEHGSGRLIGYCASRDRYQKRDELGAIFQLCIDPTAQRMFVGANLLQAVFERAPYGCKLFCCWCAQDLAANRFWESMGFVPLAFRAGSREKGRVHIFWQKRIRAGDETTPWWFPCSTSSGSIREDRLVLPIPPGLRWNDEMPRVLPVEGKPKPEVRNPKQIQNQNPRSKIRNPGTSGDKRNHITAAVPSFTPRPIAIEVVKPPKASKTKMKIDPELIVAARELRDRWLERMNSLPAIPVGGKYQITRQLPSADGSGSGEVRQRFLSIAAA